MSVLLLSSPAVGTVYAGSFNWSVMSYFSEWFESLKTFSLTFKLHKLWKLIVKRSRVIPHDLLGHWCAQVLRHPSAQRRRTYAHRLTCLGD